MGNVTAVKEQGWKFVIRSNDHPPPHVHVFFGGRTCRVTLGRPKVEPPALYPWASPKKTTLSARECAEAVRLVGVHNAAVVAEWERCHGKLE